MSTSEGKCVFVEVGALISWCIYSYRIVMLLVPYMWASMTFLPKCCPYNSASALTEHFHLPIDMLALRYQMALSVHTDSIR